VGEGELDCVFGCQRSSTDPFLPLALGGRDLSAEASVGDGGVASNCELAFTLFCTNPRPCSLLRLGVKSF